MAQRDDLGDRRHQRIGCQRQGFVITEPSAPWIECGIVDVSESGICIDVGALPLPEIFGVAFTPCGTVLRVCARVWRQGERVGGRFLTSRELRQSVPACDLTAALVTESQD